MVCGLLFVLFGIFTKNELVSQKIPCYFLCTFKKQICFSNSSNQNGFS